jgi:hypothetical protein
MPRSARPTPPLLLPPAQPYQLSIALDAIILRGMTPSEREKVLSHLGQPPAAGRRRRDRGA